MSQSVGAEPGMNQRKGAFHALVGQIQIKSFDLDSHQQALIDNGVARHAADVKVVGFVLRDTAVGQGMLDDFADHVQLAFNLNGVPHVRTPADEHLADLRADCAGISTQFPWVGRDVSPAQENQTFVDDHPLDKRLALDLRVFLRW